MAAEARAAAEPEEAGSEPEEDEVLSVSIEENDAE